MEELYWITRVGALSYILCISAFVSFAVSFALGIYLMVNASEYNPTSEWGSDRAFAKLYDSLRKALKVFGIVFIITIVTSIFVPSKKEMLLIYGGGTMIDFVENDSIAKQLPHEAVEALHKYLTEE